MKKSIEWKIRGIALGLAASLLLAPTPVRSAVQDNLESALELIIGDKSDSTDKENYTDATVCAKLNLMQEELNTLQGDVTELKDTSPSAQAQITVTEKDGNPVNVDWNTMITVGDDIYVIGTYYTGEENLLRWHVDHWEFLGGMPYYAIYKNLVYFNDSVYLFISPQNQDLLEVYRYTTETGFTLVSSYEHPSTAISVAAYKNKVHIFCSNRQHITWDGSNWEVLDELPSVENSSERFNTTVFQDALYYAYKYNDTLHVLKYNETSLEQDSSIKIMNRQCSVKLIGTENALYVSMYKDVSSPGATIYRVNEDVTIERIGEVRINAYHFYSRAGQMFMLQSVSNTVFPTIKEYVWLDNHFIQNQLHKHYAIKGEKIICDKNRTFVYGDNLEEIPEGYKITANGNIGIEGECTYTIVH